MSSESRNRVTLLVGHPGGSGAIERFLGESMVSGDIESALERAHPQWEKNAVIHMQRSIFCPPKSALHSSSLKIMQRGQMLSIFLGHSGASGLYSDGVHYLSREAWLGTSIHPSAGVFLTCGCWSCHVGGTRGDGYGLAAIRNPAGPVAVVGAFGESYGAMGKLALEGVLPLLGAARAPRRLGDWWLAIKGGLAKGEISSTKFIMYDKADGSNGKVPLEVQRDEHLEMWMLLGDPAMHLPLSPPTLSLNIKGTSTGNNIEPTKRGVSAGETLVVSGDLPESLTATPNVPISIEVTLERPFGTLPPDFTKSISRKKGPRQDLMYLARMRKANDVVVLRVTPEISKRHFTCKVQLPPLPFKFVTIRVRAHSKDKMAYGVKTLKVLSLELVKR